MRVTFVSYDDDPPLGGQGVVVHGMREALTARGIEVSTVSGRGEHAVRYPRVTRRAPLDLSLWLNRNPRLLTAADPDVVHAQGGPGGVLLLRRPVVPLVYTAHHTYSQAYGWTQPRRALSALEAAAYRHAARVLAVSPSTADALRRMRIDANRIEVVPPGVGVAPLEPSLREPGRMLFVGRLEAEKGAVTAVTVMRAISRARPGSSAAVIGGGGQSARVRDAAQGDPSVEVLGRVDEKTLRRELARASVVLMPSRYEGLGLVALEAQERGTPVVGYDVTGLRDAVHGGGLLVPRDDVDALRRACLRVLDDPALAAELSERGRAFVQREHSWAVVGARLLEAYQAVLGGSGRLTGAAARP